MAGLLDFNDPNSLNTLGLIGGLLSARKGDNWPLMLQQAAMRQEAIRRGQVDEEMRRQQMEAEKLRMEREKKAAAREDAMQALAQRFQTPGVTPATPMDDEGNPMPSSPPGYDYGGFAQALAGINPQASMAMRAQLAQMGAKERVKVGPGETVGSYQNGRFVPDYTAPKQEKLTYHDLGGYISVRDSSNKEVGRLPKTAGPEKPQKPVWDSERGGFITPEGFQPVPGVGPKKVPEQERISEGRERVSAHLGTIRGYYSALAKEGGAVSTAQPALTNIRARMGASAGGQLLGGAIGTEAQTLRDKIQSMRPLLIQEIRSATGMSAKAMDSNAELQFYLRAATDPTQSLEANMAAIDALERAYGLGGQKQGGDKPDPLGIR